MHLGSVVTSEVGGLILHENDLVIGHADLLYQILMFHSVFIRDFMLLTTKSNYELIEVINDRLDFFALGKYLACRSWSVLRLFLWLSVTFLRSHVNDENHCFDILLGQL